MLGALAGDIIGSTREHYPVKTLDFELFPEGSRVTDDSVMTVATAEALYGGVPAAIATRVQQMIPGDLGLVVESFRVRWG